MQIETYLYFPGTCEEALVFYAKCLGGGTPEGINRYAGSPMDTPQLPPEWKDKVMHANFVSGSARFMASDGMPGQPAPVYSGFSMSINLPKDKARAQEVFNALADGGQVTMPLADTFWGAYFGMLTDRFGIPWMLNCEA